MPRYKDSEGIFLGSYMLLRGHFSYSGLEVKGVSYGECCFSGSACALVENKMCFFIIPQSC